MDTNHCETSCTNHYEGCYTGKWCSRKFLQGCRNLKVERSSAVLFSQQLLQRKNAKNVRCDVSYTRQFFVQRVSPQNCETISVTWNAAWCNTAIIHLALQYANPVTLTTSALSFLRAQIRPMKYNKKMTFTNTSMAYPSLSAANVGGSMGFGLTLREPKNVAWLHRHCVNLLEDLSPT